MHFHSPYPSYLIVFIFHYNLFTLNKLSSQIIGLTGIVVLTAPQEQLKKKKKALTNDSRGSRKEKGEEGSVNLHVSKGRRRKKYCSVFWGHL